MNDTSDVFSGYVKRHWRQLHSLSRRYVFHEEDARDLVQETILRAWRNFHQAEERTCHKAWLLVIMRNIALDWHRSTQRRVKLVPVADGELTELAPADLTEPFSSLPATDEERFRNFLDDRVVSALDRLEPVFREVVLLSTLGELNYREIGEVLDCPVGTVMSRMARARRALRENLSAYARETGWIKETRS